MDSILKKKINFFEGIVQNMGVIMIRISSALIQFNGRAINEAGSKLENRFAIIINFG